MTSFPFFAILAMSTVCLTSIWGENLVSNGGFDIPGAATSPRPALTIPDDRVPQWDMQAEWYVDSDEKSPIEGTFVLRADGQKGTAGVLGQRIDLQPGQPYTLSAWVKAEGLSKTGPGLGDARTSVIVTNWNWSKSFSLVDSSTFTSTWKRYTVTFVAPKEYKIGGVVQPCKLRLFLPLGETGSLWVTGLQIEKGESASAFQSISTTEKEELTEHLTAQFASIRKIKTMLVEFEGTARETRSAQLADLEGRLNGALLKVKEKGTGSTPAWHTLASECQKLIDEAALLSQPIAWWENPWNDLGRRVLPAEAPSEKKSLTRIVLARNDYGALLLPIANLSMDSLAVEVSIGDQVAPLSTLSTFDGPIAVSAIQRVSHEGITPQGGAVAPVKEGQDYPYLLEPLGNSNTLLLPGAETSQLWLDVRTASLPPGVHRYPIRLKGLTTRFSWEGEIEIEVLPVDLPERVPTNVISYSSMPFFMEPFAPNSEGKPLLKMSKEDRLKIAGPWLEIWKEMGFNRLMLTTQYLKVAFDEKGDLAQPIDYAVLDAYQQLWSTIGAEYWGGYNFAAYHIYQSWKDTPNLIPGSLAKQRTKALFQSLIEHAQALGLTPENFPICMFDEPHGPQVPIVQQGVEVLKEIAPGWKVISTVAGTQAGHVKALVPLIDIFVVRQRMGEIDMAPEGIQYLLSQGKEVWGYSCSGSMQYLNPYRYFRLLPWQAWSNGLSGYGVFMNFNAEEYSKIGARSAFYSPLFLGKNGPVIGKGARGFQLGGRDWALFTLVKNRVAELRNNGAVKEADTLEHHLAEAIRATLADENDASRADAARTTLLRELAAAPTH